MIPWHCTKWSLADTSVANLQIGMGNEDIL